MAFGDVNIQNTQTTTVTPQSTPVATPVVPQAKPVVIDLELQKLLHALNLTIEQWQAMSPQEQANARTQYAQNQQQVASEQTGMGIPGLSVERTTDDVQAQQGVTSQAVADDNTADNKEKSTPSTTTETSEKRNDPSWLEWRIKSNENKREFLKQKLVENGKFENYTDEQIDELFDNYIEYKTKERLVKKEKDISDDAWKKLTAEEKLQMMDETWKAISDDKDRQKAINKTISDYSLIVSAGITLDEYNSLSRAQKSLLAAKEAANQIEKLKTSEQADSVEVQDAIAGNEIEKSRQLSRAVGNAAQKSTFKTTGKYNDIVNVALNSQGIKDAENTSDDEKADAIVEYMKNEVKDIEDPDTRKAVLLDMYASLLNNNSSKKIDGLAFKVIEKIGLDVDDTEDLLAILEDEEICNNLSARAYEVATEGTTEDVEVAIKSMEVVAEQTMNVGHVHGAHLPATVGAKFAQGLIDRANSDDPEDVKVAQKSTGFMMRSTKIMRDLAIAALNKDDTNGADVLVGEYAHIEDKKVRQEAFDGAIKNRDEATQERRTSNFINAKPNSKATYDTVNETASKGYYHKDAQVDVAKMVTSKAKENLSEDDAKQVHKDTFDAAVVGFDAENHDDVYEIMMNSGFTDVQEYAANNIYKLDESVRDWAEEYTKSLDIESVTNAIQTEPPVTVEENNSQVDNSSSYAQSEIITTSEVYAVNNVIHEIKTTLTDELTGEIKLDLNKQEDRNKLVSFFEQHPLEMAKYIEKAPLKNKESLLIALCQSSKNAAISFVKQNPSFGLIILSSSQIELGVQRDVALVMLQKADKGSDVWKTASEFIGKFYKGETNVENHKSLMFKA